MIDSLRKRFQSTEARHSGAEHTAECAHGITTATGPCLECKTAKKVARRYRFKLIFGLFFPFSLAALDATILASALPWIAADFNKFSQLNWIISAFNLTAAAFIPIWAQIADVFGRNFGLNAAIVLMIFGSALCTGAPTNAFPLLLLGRAFQGIAAAGINVLSRTILADKVSLKENAKNWAVFSMVGGVSYALGPLIGGYLTNADYRWCFAINLPVGVLGLLLTMLLLRKELLGPQPIPELHETSAPGRRARLVARLKTIDYGGQALFILGFGLVILALTWGGVTYPWKSAAVLTSLVLGLALVVCFILYERSFVENRLIARTMPWQKPMVPWSLLSCRDIGLLFYTECVTGMGLFAVLYFCNIYFTAVKNYSADEAGVQLLYFTPGLGAGTIGCALMTNKWPRNTFSPILLGTIVEAVGLGLLAWACWLNHIANVYGFMAMVGAGVGLRMMAAPLHGMGLFRQHRAAIIALMAVTIPLGGTIGLTIMSAVFNNTSGLSSHETELNSLDTRDGGPQDDIVQNAKMGVVWAFVALTPFTILSIVCACLIGNVKLGQGTGDQEDGGDNVVIRGVYLMTLFKGTSNRGTVRAEGMEPPAQRGDETLQKAT